MKLIISRMGSGWGGPLGTGIIDLNEETISYFNHVFELSEKNIINLLKQEPLNTEEIDLSNVDFQYLREELKIGLMKEVEGFISMDAQEDYAFLEKDNVLEMVYREDNLACITLQNTKLYKMIKVLVNQVR